MKTKDLDAASVASDSPNKRQGQAQHSPLPWMVGKSYHTSNRAVLCKHGEMIAMIYTLANHKCTEEKDDANAAFIVRAVNNVELLAEACKARLNEWHSDNQNFTRAEPASLEMMRAALKAYEKGKQQ